MAPTSTPPKQSPRTRQKATTPALLPPGVRDGSAGLDVSWMPVGDLVAYEGNSNDHSEEQVTLLRRAIDEWGWTVPLLVNAESVVIAGHGRRLAALREPVLELVPTISRPHWTPAQVDAYRIWDNQSARLSTTDREKLRAELLGLGADLDLDLIGFGSPAALHAATGWTANDLVRMLAGQETTTIHGDPDAYPQSVPEITKPGDVWLLGSHRLLCGSTGDDAALTALMTPKGGERVQAAMVWTDPPYGVDYEGKTADKLKIKGDDAAGLELLLEQMVQAILAGAAPGAAVYVAAPAGRQSLTFAQALDRVGMFRQRLVWVKDRFVLGHSDFHYRHEDLYQGYVPTHDDLYYGYVPGPVRGRGRAGWFGKNSESTVLDFPRPSASKEHPTMKPTALIEYCLRLSALPGAVVLDLFAGSGSTMIACQQHGSTAYLMELDPHYCDVICARWERATGVVPVLERTGKPRKFSTTS